MPGYWSTIIEAQADGTALNTSVTATSILPAQAKWTMPANYLYRIGKTLRIMATGRVSNIVTTPGTLTFFVRFGSVNVATSRAIALNTTAKTNVGWYLDLHMVVRAIGATTTANMMTNGTWESESVVGSPAGASGTVTWQDAPAVGTGFDSTAAQQIDLWAQWSVNNAANSIQLHTYELVDITTTP